MFLGLFLADAGAELSYFGFLQPLIKLLKLRMKKMLSRGSRNRREFKYSGADPKNTVSATVQFTWHFSLSILCILCWQNSYN